MQSLTLSHTELLPKTTERERKKKEVGGGSERHYIRGGMKLYLRF
jgi:hypothetical protein